MDSASKSLCWVVKGFRNGQAVLVANSNELLVPRTMLPPKTKEGDVVTAEFFHAHDEPKRRENLAKALLEEILSVE